jgi:hypothetical protein
MFSEEKNPAMARHAYVRIYECMYVCMYVFSFWFVALAWNAGKELGTRLRSSRGSCEAGRFLGGSGKLLYKRFWELLGSSGKLRECCGDSWEGVGQVFGSSGKLLRIFGNLR